MKNRRLSACFPPVSSHMTSFWKAQVSPDKAAPPEPTLVPAPHSPSSRLSSLVSCLTAWMDALFISVKTGKGALLSRCEIKPEIRNECILLQSINQSFARRPSVGARRAAPRAPFPETVKGNKIKSSVHTSALFFVLRSSFQAILGWPSRLWRPHPRASALPSPCL